jgi:hypothetical protein
MLQFKDASSMRVTPSAINVRWHSEDGMTVQANVLYDLEGNIMSSMIHGGDYDVPQRISVSDLK